MSKNDFPPEFIDVVSKITKKRPRTVIDHILEHGQITTQELRDLYGYNHPPRAARDVREEGIPLKMVRVEGTDGRKISAYSFGDISSIESHRLGGRKVFSKVFTKKLIEECDSRCTICNEKYSERYLQIDHRIPYEIAGESGQIGQECEPACFMPVCGTCNRKKSWSCEQCDNWNTAKKAIVCERCYWASPHDYDHIALSKLGRVELVWSKSDYKQFVRITKEAKKHKISLNEYIKNLLENCTK